MSDRIPANLRRLVQERAEQRCEYCLLHSDNAFLSHEPDHVIARKHDGRTIEENLAWSCFICNRFKGTDISSIDPESGEITSLFHPRKDEWNEHFRWNNCWVDGQRQGHLVPVAIQPDGER